jgi:hypothetical protein
LGQGRMTLDDMQTAAICGIFGLVGAAAMYRALSRSSVRAKHSRWYTLFITLAAGLAAAMAWFLFDAILDLLPEKWSGPVSQIGLVVLMLFALWKPVRMWNVERDSTRRIQVGILIGIVVLIAFCLIAFWPR